nr:MAG TPA: hypothetical protein [Caudoviricetes sp.]
MTSFSPLELSFRWLFTPIFMILFSRKLFNYFYHLFFS